MAVRLIDKTSPHVEEEAEIPLVEVSPRDLPFVKDGSVFYWSIGYHDDQHGQRTRQSIIIFRRLPAWTPDDLLAIDRKVEERKRLFEWE
jgi:hypothetical protein